MDAIQTIEKILSEDKKSFFKKNDCKGRYQQIFFLEALRSMEVAFYLSHDRRMDSFARLVKYGLKYFVDKFYDRGIQDTYPIFPTNDSFSRRVDSYLSHSGYIGVCESALEHVRIGTHEILPLSRGRFRFSFRGNNCPRDIIELAELERYYANKTEHKEIKDFISKFEKEIRTQLSTVTSSWRKHYIQYDSNLEIDAYFKMVGLFYTSKCTCNDLFSFDFKFDGIKYGEYDVIISFLSGLAVKHLWSCEELMKKQSDISLRNIITYTTVLSDLIEDCSIATGISKEKVEIILENITLCEENIVNLYGTDSLPPLIRLTNTVVARSVWGSLGNPYGFLQRELKRKYSREWDEAQQKRENIFREELNIEMGTMLGVSTSLYEIDLKKEGGMATDIDAAYFDGKNGHLALVQLKWQDRYIGMRERDSKNSNFVSASNRWINTVLMWAEKNSQIEIARQLHLNEFGSVEIKKIFLFIIGRNYSFTTYEDEYDTRAAWVSWPVLHKLIDKNKCHKSFLAKPIENLFHFSRRATQKKIKNAKYEKIFIGGRELQIRTLDIEDK